MDFGDILKQWDSIQKDEKKNGSSASHSKQNSSKKITYEDKMQKEAQQAANPMDVWLRRYGVIDKDAAADEYNQRERQESREYLKEMRPEEFIDLHGMTREEAWQRLDSFVSECKRRGLRKILIIHGKGNHSAGSDPVLGEMVRTFIEEDKRLGTSGHPDKNHGGNGATWAIIKQ